MVEEGQVSLDNASISLHAIVGTPNPRTMRVLSLINRKHVVILIDTGNPHTFLDLALVHKCKFDVQRGKPIQVRVANGEVLTSEGRSTTVPLWLLSWVSNGYSHWGQFSWTLQNLLCVFLTTLNPCL